MSHDEHGSVTRVEVEYEDGTTNSLSGEDARVFGGIIDAQETTSSGWNHSPHRWRDLDRLEVEVGEWAEENFGAEQPDYYPLVGAAEELGEIASLYRPARLGRVTEVLGLIDATGLIAHSVLKQAQGIREDDDDVGPRAEERAISKAHNCLDGLGRHDVDRVGSAQFHPETDPGELSDGIGDVLVYLADYNYRQRLSPMTYGEAVSLAWDGEVKDREWDADVNTGQ